MRGGAGFYAAADWTWCGPAELQAKPEQVRPGQETTPSLGKPEEGTRDEKNLIVPEVHEDVSAHQELEKKMQHDPNEGIISMTGTHNSKYT